MSVAETYRYVGAADDPWAARAGWGLTSQRIDKAPAEWRQRRESIPLE